MNRSSLPHFSAASTRRRPEHATRDCGALAGCSLDAAPIHTTRGGMVHDVIVVGGSYAGLAAALQLGRARRTVLVLDAGQRRNRFVGHSHGFLSQDGVPPGEIAAKGKAEV